MLLLLKGDDREFVEVQVYDKYGNMLNTYKAVAPGLAGAPVGDDHRLLDLAVHLEVFS